jgi:energy-coupling factor transport system permease protein
MPVLVDALDRSLALAAAMDSRGYGRGGGVSRSVRLVTGTLVVAGLLGVCIGAYGLLDGTTPAWLGLPMLLLGLLVAAVGLPLAGRRVRRSVYRPDPWRLPETLVAASGLATAAVLVLTSTVDPGNLYPSLEPLSWPGLPLAGALGVLVALLPAWAAPPPVSVVTAPRTVTA